MTVILQLRVNEESSDGALIPEFPVDTVYSDLCLKKAKEWRIWEHSRQ